MFMLELFSDWSRIFFFFVFVFNYVTKNIDIIGTLYWSLIVIPLSVVLFVLGSNYIKYKNFENTLWTISYYSSVITLLISCLLVYYFNEGYSFYQYTFTYAWDHFRLFDLNIGLDGLSLSLIVLTNYLICICIMASRLTVFYKLKFHIICFSFLQIFLILAFSVLDLFWFYIFFESILIPMFLLIGIWGSRIRRIKATYMLFIYTALGSLLLLMAILFFLLNLGTTDVRILYLIDIPFSIERLLFIVIFLSFCIKTPMFPFHIWLPEAHVEASTTGSMLLAGILLKLGTYGMVRFLIPIFPSAVEFYSLFVLVLSLVGMVIISFIILSQIDLKKIIAYASIAHMATVVIGLFTSTVNGYVGSVFMMVGHGFIASGLFFCIGILYSRYHSRLINYYAGLVRGMPLFTICFFLLLLLNIGFPGTVGFFSEFLVLSSLQLTNSLLLPLFFIGFLTTVLYSLWIFNRTCFLTENSVKSRLQVLSLVDINISELIILLSLIAISILLGIFPSTLIDIL